MSNNKENSIPKTNFWENSGVILGRIFAFIASGFGNTVAQAIGSMKVSKNKTNLINSLSNIKYSGVLVAVETLFEPGMFKSIDDIKKWILEKSYNNIDRKKVLEPLLGVIFILSVLSYSGVVLDKLSNDKLENFYSIDVWKSFGTEFIFSFVTMFCHEEIIDKLVEIPVIKKFFNIKIEHDESDDRCVLLDDVNVDQNDEHLLLAETKKPYWKIGLEIGTFFNVSVLNSWVNEMFISDEEFSKEKLLNDISYVAGSGALSVFSSLMNYIVNCDISLNFIWNSINCFKKKEIKSSSENNVPCTADADLRSSSSIVIY